MADYTQFEIYVPRYYKPKYSQHLQATDYRLFLEFINDTVREFGGITQSNPNTATFFGWWKDRETSILDQHTYFFTFVKSYEQENGIQFFTEWKQKFESTLNQKYVLVVFQSVQTIGDYF